MPSWLITAIALFCVAGLVALAVGALVRDHRKGASSCGGKCASCPYGGCCSRVQTGEKK